MLIAFVASTLTACGGGGSGSGSTTDNIDNSATLVASPTAVTVSAQTTDPAPTALIQISLQLTSSASASQQYYVTGTNTHSGISSASVAANGTYANLNLSFKTPATLGPGTYTDTVTLKGCDDQTCTRQVINSPLVVPITYTVTEPLAQLYSIAPNSVTAGAASFTLAVNGAGFLPQSVVQWNGTPLTTTYVSSSLLTALVPAMDVSVSGSYPVTVNNGSGAVSSPLALTVKPLAPLVLTSISPTEVSAGGPGFQLAAIGTGFAASTSILWNGTSLPTTYISSTLIRAQVTAAQIATAGTASITLVDSARSWNGSPIAITIAPPSIDAVAYQMNAAHTGAVTFKTATLPVNSAWSVDVGGTASYALIVGGNVYVTVAVNGNSQLMALNGATGATLWGPIALSGLVNVAYDRGRVFVVTGSPPTQIISGLDATTGHSVWSATVPGSWFPEPPVATGGIVYTTNGGVVTAFDETNGATLWTTSISGTDGIVAVTADGLYGAAPCTALELQPAVGTQLWYHNSGCEGGGGATPVVANGLVYAPNSSSTSSGVVFDAQTGTVKGSYSASVIPAFSSSAGYILFNGTLRGVTVPDNQILWSFAGDGELTTAPVVVNNYVFIGSQSGNLYGLDAVSGQQVWTQNLGATIPATNEYGPYQYSGLAAGDGLLIVPNGNRVTAFVLSTTP